MRLHQNSYPYNHTSNGYHSPERQSSPSSSSDTSDTEDINSKSKPTDSSIPKQPSLNFFRSNHDMEASMKRLTQALTTTVIVFCFSSSIILISDFLFFNRL